MRAVAFIVFFILSGDLIAAPTRYPIPSGATAIRHLRITDTGGEQDYFEIRLEYPSTLILDHYRKVFSRWTECKPPKTWQSFGDITGPSPRFIHQLLSQWVSADNRSSVTLAARYYSEGVQHRSRPDNDIQRVALIEYKVPDARAHAALLGYQCAGA